MALSKSKRFDIFRRDNFTCRYCGQRPPDVVLEVDHIQPVSKGGTDEDLNLITACWDCNRGKSNKLLADAGPRPDADLEFLAIQQEVAEIKRYIAAKDERDEAVELLIGVLQTTWSTYLTPEYEPKDIIVRRWLINYTPDEIEAAIKAASPTFHSGRIYGGFTGLVNYVAGTMKRRREAGE